MRADYTILSKLLSRVCTFDEASVADYTFITNNVARRNLTRNNIAFIDKREGETMVNAVTAPAGAATSERGMGDEGNLTTVERVGS